MAKIEQLAGSSTAAETSQAAQSNKSKKRKLKDLQAASNDDDRSADVDSPTSKFKKLDISQVSYRRHRRRAKPPPQSPPSPPTAVRSVVESPTPPQSPTPSTSSQQLHSAAAATDSGQTQQPSQAPTENKAKANKRKKKSTPGDAAKSPKIAKTSRNAAAAADEEAVNAEEEPRDPTMAELSAADRPENQPQIETTRGKKRKKHAKVQLTARVDSAQREQLRNREYLLQWRDQRAAWKFSKLRQISVTKLLFSEAADEQLDDELWQVAMEYLCGTKGQLRKLLCDAAQKVIDDVDARIGAERTNSELVQQVNYTRARSFLQMME